MTKCDVLKEYAMSMVGTPYIWGGDDPILGFDCSGFVQELLAAVGMDPEGDQTANTLYHYFTRNGSMGEKGLGALAFYGHPENVTHIAMMIDYDRIIEAGGGGSKTLTEQNAIDQNAFVRIRPLYRRNDLVAVIMPKY